MRIDKLTEHKFILFVEDHYNPLDMARSIGEAGLNPIVILVADNPCMLNHCKYVKICHIVSTIEEGYNMLLEYYGDEPFKPFLLTAHDPIIKFIDSHYDELISKFYFFNGGAQGMISRYMDKDTICHVAEECGIDRPKGELLNKGELPNNLKYPVLTKVTDSTLGGWKDDVYICKDEEELKSAYLNIKADKLLVQEYIVKKNELCVDGFSINGGEQIWTPFTAEYLHFTDKGYGKYMRFLPLAKEIEIKIQNILKKVNYSGIFELECLIDENDKLYFLEVNFRNSTWSYAYTYAGLNLPYQWAKSTLEGKIDYSSAQIKEGPFTAMDEFGYFREGVMSGQVGLLRWIKQFATCDVHYYYNSKDKIPFYSGLMGKFLKVFRSSSRKK